MSAGIFVLNKQAVSMAADSAVTISKKGEKLLTHNSANKMFNIGESKPVGIIVYSDSEFMNVPFEIILDDYKNSTIQDSTKEQLVDYIPSLINHIQSRSSYFDFVESELIYLFKLLIPLLSSIESEFKVKLDDEIRRTNKEVEVDRKHELWNESFDILKERIQQKSDLENFDVNIYVKKNYEDSLKKLIKERLKDLNNEMLDSVLSMFLEALHKDYFPFYVGLAIAGYGNKEAFPSAEKYKFSGVIDKKLRLNRIQHSVISPRNNEASIITLAQDDVMDLFIYGTDFQYVTLIRSELEKLEKKILEQIEEATKKTKKDKMIQSLKDSVKCIPDEVIKKIRNDYIDPILDSIAMLPIDELGLFAESMIYLTSFRRKVIADNNSETVGGPIDLAIITKAHGFKWIKKKRHFLDNQEEIK